MLVLLIFLKNVLRDDTNKMAEKIRWCEALIGNANMEGGGTELGTKLYRKYDIVKEFWGHPFNLVHINIIAVLEIINSYLGAVPQYSMFYWYLAVYGIGSLAVQSISFIVHYKGKTVDHYYLAVFKKE